MVPKVGNLINLFLPISPENVFTLCPVMTAHIVRATKSIAQLPMADLLATRGLRLVGGIFCGAFDDSDARECAISVPLASPDARSEVKDGVLE